jgi:hypothetical protein
MQRGLIALIAGMAVGLGAVASAAASDTLVATGDATSVTANGADLNGVVFRDHVGARWLFEYSTSSRFNAAVMTTTPVAMHGRLTVVERRVSGLRAHTTYYWRVVVAVRSGTRAVQIFGQTETLTTLAAPSLKTTTAPSTPTVTPVFVGPTPAAGAPTTTTTTTTATPPADTTATDTTPTDTTATDTTATDTTATDTTATDTTPTDTTATDTTPTDTTATDTTATDTTATDTTATDTTPADTTATDTTPTDTTPTGTTPTGS